LVILYKPFYFNYIRSRKNPVGNRDCRQKTQCWEKNATAEKTTPETEEKIQQFQ